MDGLSKHDRIKQKIVSKCQNLGIAAVQEFKGKDWRADVYIPNKDRLIAFEIQLSPQTLKRTVERQAKYIRDGITGCWFFENPVSKLNCERPDLPLFYVEDGDDSSMMVNLGDRRKVDIQVFLESFISNGIQFKTVAQAKRNQRIDLVFFDMTCWKCHELNHLYYVATPFYSACHARIKPEEALWESNNMAYRPEVIALAQEFVVNNKHLGLKLSLIKKRHSHTVNHSYTSFGCHKCDSLFGDFHVMEAKMDVMYEMDNLTYSGEVEIADNIQLPVPHWCFPDNGHFCGE